MCVQLAPLKRAAHKLGAAVPRRTNSREQRAAPADEALPGTTFVFLFHQVTGGSSGIGKHVAIEAAKRGAHVTIVARDEKKLLQAQEEIKKASCPNPKFIRFIEYVSLDISKDYENIRSALQPAMDRCGPVYMLVNCAGMALCGTLEEMTMQDIKTVIDLNLYGTIHMTKALVEGMKQRGRGCIVITASQAANLGIYGLAAYTSSKFALKGFAEALYMEVKQSGLTITLCLPPDTDTPGFENEEKSKPRETSLISQTGGLYRPEVVAKQLLEVKQSGLTITLCLPPDTDTPGFENEEKSKPRETSLISQTGGLYRPEVVAKQLLEDALKGNYFSTVGLESYLITTLCAGFSPIVSIQETFIQAFLMGPLRLTAIYLHWTFDNIVKKCRKSQ
ncbi:3-ketodihydrosphingosine reductase-like [Diaphorina citri]|uniref:3-dehydrosphinganine reductase n=1 Tax=Diaphorina citri TaxID=121845 RepID=A0A3Q0ITU0_DIACI|nr:3-ketodihydrosphingosine reductase-like [Diaphorina citri]